MEKVTVAMKRTKLKFIDECNLLRIALSSNFCRIFKVIFLQRMEEEWKHNRRENSTMHYLFFLQNPIVLLVLIQIKFC